MIVFLVAGIGAAPTTDAHGKIKRVAELHAWDCFRRSDMDVDAVFLFGVGFNALEDISQFLRVEFLVMFAQILIHRLGWLPLGEWSNGSGKGCCAERRSSDLQGIPTRHATVTRRFRIGAGRITHDGRLARIDS